MGRDRTPDRRAFHWVERSRSLTYAEAVHGDGPCRRRAGGPRCRARRPRRHLRPQRSRLPHGHVRHLAARCHLHAVNLQYADSLDYYVNDAGRVSSSTRATTSTRSSGTGRTCRSIEHYVCFDGAQDGAIGWEEMLRGRRRAARRPGRGDRRRPPLVHLRARPGAPKGACLAHEPTMRATRCIAERLRMRADDVSLGPTALSSSYQLVANLLPVLHAGGTTLRDEPLERRGRVGRRRAARGDGAGGQPNRADATSLDESARRGATAQPRSVLGLSGGGPVPPDLKRRWHDALGIPLCESYGQSELGGFVGLAAPDDPFTEDRLLVVWAAAAGQGGARPRRRRHGRCPVGADRRAVPTRRATWPATGSVPRRRPRRCAAAGCTPATSGYLDAEGYVFMRGRLSERLTRRRRALVPARHRGGPGAPPRRDATSRWSARRTTTAGTARWPSSHCGPAPTCAPAELAAFVGSSRRPRASRHRGARSSTPCR